MNLQQERFVAAYVGAAHGNASEAARVAEYRHPGQQGERLLKRVEIQQRIAETRAAIRAEGVATLQNRLDAYNDRWRKLQTVIAARAADIGMAAVPGGTTGLLVETIKSVGTGEAALIVREYAVDTGLLKAMLELERQAAIEAGQWEEPGKNEAVGVRVLVGVNVNDL